MISNSRRKKIDYKMIVVKDQIDPSLSRYTATSWVQFLSQLPNSYADPRRLAGITKSSKPAFLLWKGTDKHGCQSKEQSLKLFWIANSTRLDIQFSTSKWAQYMSAPTQMQLQMRHKIVLRYLKETRNRIGLQKQLRQEFNDLCRWRFCKWGRLAIFLRCGWFSSNQQI